MDLTNLRDSLDSSSRHQHPASASAKRSELRLTRDFKAAAFQLTTLYRTSLSTSKRSYAAGYAQSLADVLDVVQLRMQQHPTTAPGSRLNATSTALAESVAEAEREELHWLVRYLRARLEAIKAESEEDEEMEASEDDEEVPASATAAQHAREAPGRAKATTVNTGAEAQQPASDSYLSQAREARTLSSSTGDGREAGAFVRSSSVSRDDREQRPSDPASAPFTFTAPVASASRNSTRGPSTTRGRRGRGHAAASQTASAGSRAANTPPRIPRASSSDEDELTVTPTSRHGPYSSARRSAATTPSSMAGSVTSSPASTPAAAVAAASRLGKRRNGRERLSNLELFGRAMTAKRRRHFGDRTGSEDRTSPTP